MSRNETLFELKPFIIRDWMDYKGDIEHEYTLNECVLPSWSFEDSKA